MDSERLMALEESERLRRAETHRFAADLSARDRLIDQLKHQVHNLWPLTLTSSPNASRMQWLWPRAARAHVWQRDRTCTPLVPA